MKTVVITFYLTAGMVGIALGVMDQDLITLGAAVFVIACAVNYLRE